MLNLKKNIIDRTKSICPVCRNNIDADIIEENGSVWLEKSCISHGFFKVKIAKYAWYYKELNRFYKLMYPRLPAHDKKGTKIYLFYPTLNCDLNCKICFSDSKNTNKDMELVEIERMVKAIKEPRRIIFMLGGEPTVREDLDEVIKIIIKSGHHPVIITNGVKLADIDYLRKLRKCGLRYAVMWVDSLNDDSVYEMTRGRKLLAVKLKALENLRFLGITTGIVRVLVRKINEEGIKEIIDYGRRHTHISSVIIRSYSNLGRKAFSPQEEFTIDEMIDIVSRQTNGLTTLEEFFLFQKVNYIIRVLLLNKPACYIKQYIFVPKECRGKKMREMIDLQKLARYLEEFERIYMDSPLKAKIYFLEKIFLRLAINPKFLYSMGKQTIYPNQRDYIRLVATSFYTPYTYDLNKIATQCYYAWLPSYNDDNLTGFCKLLVDGYPCY